MLLSSGVKENSKNIFYSSSTNLTHADFQFPQICQNFWHESFAHPSHTLSSVPANSLEIPDPGAVLLALITVIKNTNLSHAVATT